MAATISAFGAASEWHLLQFQNVVSHPKLFWGEWRWRRAGGECETRLVSCASISSSQEITTQRERQELLWRHFFSTPSDWWDNRADKKSARHPDFRHKTSWEPLWLDNYHKPAWVDTQLARWDSQLGKGHGDGEEEEDSGVQGLWPSSSSEPAWNDGGGEHAVLQTLRRRCEEAELSEAVEALDLLVQWGCHISRTLFYRLLKRCMAQKDLACGRRVHSLAVERGLGSSAFLATHIIGMYASHGKLRDAVQAFRDVPMPDVYMWSSIISAHTRHGQPSKAISFYREMREAGTGLEPDNHIFVAALSACASAEDLVAGKEVHAHIQASAVNTDIFVGNSLVNMYAKCGSLDDARKVFDGLPRRDVVTWNAMIAGYSQQGQGREALALYASMQRDGITVADNITFVSLLQACATVGALQQGMQLHSEIRARGLDTDSIIGNSLVSMYGRCGRLDTARNVFDTLPRRDVVTWNALLNGHAEHSDGPMAILCFEEMLQQGVQPNATTFTCLMVACSHAGLVNEGQQYFRMMVEDYGIVPSDYHHSCMVDLLSRSGQLHEAEHLLRTTSCVDDIVAWTSLLSACKGYGDLACGQRCFDHLVELAPEDASAYVLLGNLYANAGRWDEVERIEKLRKSAGAMKKAAKACIEVESRVHEFTVGEDRSDISSKLRSVNRRLKEEGGHVPQTVLVLKALPEQEKEDALCGHAEKLALAYGLLNTPDGTALLVTKNLRMCNDCHSSTKIMSRLEKREIIVRDAHRVHQFVDGSCSCRDRH